MKNKNKTQNSVFLPFLIVVILALALVLVFGNQYENTQYLPSSDFAPAPPKPSITATIGPTPNPTIAQPVVRCGQTLTRNTVLQNDLLNCPADGLIIGASGISLDCDGHLIDGINNGAYSGVNSPGRDSLTLVNCRIQEFGRGVLLYNGVKAVLLNNNATNNLYYGFQLSGVSDSTLSNNTALNNNVSGFYLAGKSLSIQNNFAKGNAGGFYLPVEKSIIRRNVADANRAAGFELVGARTTNSTSINNRVYENNATNNTGGFYIDFFSSELGGYNYAYNNTANMNYMDSFAISSKNNTLRTNLAANAIRGFEIRNSLNFLESNVANDVFDGVRIYSSVNTFLLANKIRLLPNSTNSGIFVGDSNFSKIFWNEITCYGVNSNAGVSVSYSDNVVVRNNTITNCNVGISLWPTRNSTVRENTIKNSTLHGVRLMYGTASYSPVSNFIWNNTFSKKSGVNAYESDNVTGNYWNYLTYGNCWSDYDVYHPGYPDYWIDGLGDGVDYYPRRC